MILQIQIVLFRNNRQFPLVNTNKLLPLQDSIVWHISCSVRLLAELLYTQPLHIAGSFFMQRLQRICDLYADRRTIQYTKPDADISFLYCSACTCPVNVYSSPDIQQMACMTCIAFLCPSCTVCKCGAVGSLVSDPDIRYGRLTELYASPFVFRCTVCPFFSFSGNEHSTHTMQHEMDMAPLSITVGSKTVTLMGIGTLRLANSRLMCTFTDLPYTITADGKTASGHNVQFALECTKTTVLISSAFAGEMNADVCTVAHNQELFGQRPPRPLCYTGSVRITLSELSRLKRALQQSYLLFFIPAADNHDSFSVAIYDMPWRRTAVVVCTGCLAEFASLDQLALHLNATPNWDTARRIDTVTGDFFSVNSACTAYVHATDIKFESLCRIQRDTYCNMPGKLHSFINAGSIYGLLMLPTLINRFIGIVAISNILHCALCGCPLLNMTGMSPTAILHPIAKHFTLPPTIISEFRRITLYNGHYEIDGASIIDINQIV